MRVARLFLTLFAFSAFFSSHALALPRGWQAVDIGPVEQPGASEFINTGQRFILKGAGAGVGGEEDGFHFCYQVLRGDFCIKVRLARNPDDSAQTGLMLRESLQPDARFHMITARSSIGAFAGYRMAEGEDAGGNSPVRMGWWPCWLMIGRWGDQIGMWYSQDGEMWHYSRFRGTLRDLPEEVYVGMFRTYAGNRPAEFDNVQIGSIEEVVGWKTSWVGNSLPGGNQWVQAGVVAMYADVQSGRVFLTGSDEKQSTAVYGPDGEHIAPGKHAHFCTGRAIAGDTAYYYHALPGGRRGGGIVKYEHDGDYAPGDHVVLEDHVFVGLALHDGRLYAADSEEPAVYIVNTETMQQIGQFTFERPGAMTADAEGMLWIVRRATDDEPAQIIQVSVEGQPTGRVITDVDQPRGLAVNPQTGQIYVADRYPRQQVLIFEPSGTLAGTFGVENGIFAELPGAGRGVVDPRKLNFPIGVGFDAQANLYVAANGPSARWAGGTGTELRKYAPDGTLLWARYGLEYVDMADADAATDGQDAYTKEHHYRLDYSQGSGQEWSYAGMTLDPIRYPDDPRVTQGGPGPASIRQIDGRRILYVHAMKGQWLAWYHFEPNADIAVPAGLIIGRQDGGRYEWRDANGDGSIQPQEERTVDDQLGVFSGWYTDSSGSLWVAAQDQKVRYWRCEGLDANGNPVYPDQPVIWEPQAFAGREGRINRVVYDAKRDVLFLGGYTSIHPKMGNEWAALGREIVRYDGWLANNAQNAASKVEQKPIWRLTPPYMPKPKGGHETYVATSMDVAGDYLFVIESASALIRVYEIEHGQHVATLFQGPEVGGITGLIDVEQGVTAHKRANGEYIIFAEEDSRAKVIMLRWRPPTQN